MQCLQITPLPAYLNAKCFTLKPMSSLTSCPPPSPCRRQTGNSSHRMTSPSLPFWPSATSAARQATGTSSTTPASASPRHRANTDILKSRRQTVICNMCHKATESSKIHHHPKHAAKSDTYPFSFSFVFCSALLFFCFLLLLVVGRCFFFLFSVCVCLCVCGLFSSFV